MLPCMNTVWWGFWEILDAPTLALSPLSVLIILAMPLLSTLRGSASTQNNLSREYSIIPLHSTTQLTLSDSRTAAEQVCLTNCEPV